MLRRHGLDRLQGVASAKAHRLAFDRQRPGGPDPDPARRSALFEQRPGHDRANRIPGTDDRDDVHDLMAPTFLGKVIIGSPESYRGDTRRRPARRTPRLQRPLEHGVWTHCTCCSLEAERRPNRVIPAVLRRWTA